MLNLPKTLYLSAVPFPGFHFGYYSQAALWTRLPATQISHTDYGLDTIDTVLRLMPRQSPGNRRRLMLYQSRLNQIEQNAERSPNSLQLPTVFSNHIQRVWQRHFHYSPLPYHRIVCEHIYHTCHSRLKNLDQRNKDRLQNNCFEKCFCTELQGDAHSLDRKSFEMHLNLSHYLSRVVKMCKHIMQGEEVVGPGGSARHKTFAARLLRLVAWHSETSPCSYLSSNRACASWSASCLLFFGLEGSPSLIFFQTLCIRYSMCLNFLSSSLIRVTYLLPQPEDNVHQNVFRCIHHQWLHNSSKSFHLIKLT